MAQRSNWIIRLIGAIMILLGILGGLGILGESNPLSIISDPLFNFSLSFLSETASLIFWGLMIFLGFTLVGPKRGYMGTVIELRRR